MQLTESLKENRDATYPFHMPGHKRRLAGDPLLEDIYGIDITEIEGFDNLHDAHGIIKDSEERARALYGADETHFLVNGSTGGILAAITGTVSEGDSIAAARNCHKSVFDAVMLSGADLYTVMPEPEPEFGICGGVDAGAVKAVLRQMDSGGGAGRRAVVITSPTYEGIVSNIDAISDVCHSEGAVLIVDAAHGAHFGFNACFPKSPIGSADVVICGIHKTMPAMTQTSLIHISASCPSKDRIVKMLSVFTTSSPSYVLMASIDSMTALIAGRGSELFEAYRRRLDDLYARAGKLKCLRLLDKDMLRASASADHDRGKLAIKDMTGTYSGSELADILKEKYGIMPEMAAPSYVLLMTSIADEDEGFVRLTDALFEIDGQLERSGRPCTDAAADGRPDGTFSRKISPCIKGMKAALFSSHTEKVPIGQALGRCAKDMVMVYPPGIPVMLPGERINRTDVETVIKAQRGGLEIIGLENGEITVIWE